MARLSGILHFSLVLFVCSILFSCTRAPLKDSSQALRLTRAPELSDDLPFEGLISAINTEISFLEKDPGHKVLNFGSRSIKKEDYLAALRHFADLLKSNTSREEVFRAIKRDFDFYEVYGDKGWGEAFITSYFEPIVPGSLVSTAKFSRPLYKQPDDIIGLDLVPFDPKYALDRKLRGRIVDRKLVPYYTREEIDSKGALKNKKLELVWVDPLDAFLIQVQGSATVLLGDGRSLRVGYAEKNGQPYESLGKFLKDFIPKDQISLFSIENTMRSFSAEKQQEYMNKNPSYVFFKETPSALTSLGVAASAGRTAAVDARFFPKGALVFLSTTKPKFDSLSSITPHGEEKLERFLLDQDVGGAITGGGRLDLFWGSGEDAKKFAGFMKQTGRLYYLAPKGAQK